MSRAAIVRQGQELAAEGFKSYVLRTRHSGLDLDLLVTTPAARDRHEAIRVAPEIELIRQLGLVRPGDTVVDLDARDGLHSLAMAKLAGPEGHLYGVVASPNEARLLTLNAGLNAARITVVSRPPAGGTPGLDLAELRPAVVRATINQAAGADWEAALGALESGARLVLRLRSSDDGAEEVTRAVAAELPLAGRRCAVRRPGEGKIDRTTGTAALSSPCDLFVFDDDPLPRAYLRQSRLRGGPRLPKV